MRRPDGDFAYISGHEWRFELNRRIGPLRVVRLMHSASHPNWGVAQPQPPAGTRDTRTYLYAGNAHNWAGIANPALYRPAPVPKSVHAQSRPHADFYGRGQPFPLTARQGRS